MYKKPTTLKEKMIEFVMKIIHPVKEVDLSKNDKMIIKLTKFHFPEYNELPVMKKMALIYNDIYGVDPKSYAPWKYVIYKRLFLLYMKIRKDYSGNHDLIELSSTIMIKQELFDEPDNPVDRGIIKLYNLIQNTPVLDKYGRTIINLK